MNRKKKTADNMAMTSISLEDYGYAFPHSIREGYSGDSCCVYYFHTKVLIVTIKTGRVRGRRKRGIGIGKRERQMQRE